MPIFIEFDGIQGDVKPSRHRGGANFGMVDGSVRNISRSLSRHPTGLNSIFVDGSVHNTSRSSNGGILVSKISVPNLPTGLIDERDANAVFKARLLFEGMKNLIVARGLILSISREGANKMRHTNNLKQIGLAAYGRIPTVKLLITDNSNPQGVAVELENVLITNYSISAAGGDTSTFAGEGRKVQIAFCK